MQRIALPAILAMLLTLVTASAAHAHPPGPGPHLHCLTTPGGTHAIGGGVTANAPHETAFHNFHEKVHRGAFERKSPNSPVTIVGDLVLPFECP